MSPGKTITDLFHAAAKEKRKSPALFPIRLILSGISLVYGMGILARRLLYAAGILRKKSLPGRVIGIGNLTLGGTGKTEIALAVAARLKGYRTALVSRGYGRRGLEPVQIVAGPGVPTKSYPDAADEAVLTARRSEGTAVVCGRDRFECGLAAIQRFGAEWIVLDDAFQNLSLHKDLDILVVDGTDPFGNGRLFPRGTLRERVSAMKRADAVVIAKISGADPETLREIERAVTRWCGRGVPVLRCDYRVEGVLPADGGERLSPDVLREGKWLAFSGVANNRFFHSTLRRAGTNLGETVTFPDHFPYGQGDLDRLLESADRTGADRLVTTEKDLVRLGPLRVPPGRVFAVRIGVEFQGESGDPLLEILLAIK